MVELVVEDVLEIEAVAEISESGEFLAKKLKKQAVVSVFSPELDQIAGIMTRHWALVAPRRMVEAPTRVIVRPRSLLVLSTLIALPISASTLRPSNALLSLKLNSAGVILTELLVREVVPPDPLSSRLADLLVEPSPFLVKALVAREELTDEPILPVQRTMLVEDSDTALLISEVLVRRDRRCRVVPVRPCVVSVPCPVLVV